MRLQCPLPKLAELLLTSSPGELSAKTFSIRQKILQLVDFRTHIPDKRICVLSLSLSQINEFAYSFLPRTPISLLFHLLLLPISDNTPLNFWNCRVECNLMKNFLICYKFKSGNRTQCTKQQNFYNKQNSAQNVRY